MRADAHLYALNKRTLQYRETTFASLREPILPALMALQGKESAMRSGRAQQLSQDPCAAFLWMKESVP